MSTEVRWRRGTTTQHSTFTGALGEVTVDTTKNTVVVHDGVTAGGWPVSGGTAVTKPVSANTLAELRTIDKTKTSTVTVYGHTALGDGGGGVYYFDSADTTSVDNNGLVVVGADGARWKLIHEGTVGAAQIGAFPGVGKAPSTYLNAAFQVASVKNIILGTGSYYFSGTISIPSGKSLTGSATSMATIVASGSSDLFSLGYQTSVSNLRLDCAAMTAGYVFLLNTAAANLEYVTIQNVVATNAFGLVKDSKHATNIATNIRIRNLQSRLTRGIAFDFENVFAFLEMTDCAVDHVGNATAVNAVGYRMRKNEGSYFSNCEFTGSAGITAGTNSNQVGFDIANSKAIYLQRCFADVAGGYGMNFDTCQYIRLSQCTASLCDNVGIRITNCSHVIASNIYVGGRKGMAGATAGITGFLVNSSSDCCLTAVESYNNTANGVYFLVPGVGNVITCSSLHDNSSYGFATGAGSPVLASTLNLRTNTTAGYILANVQDQLRSSLNNGTFLNVGGA